MRWRPDRHDTTTTLVHQDRGLRPEVRESRSAPVIEQPSQLLGAAGAVRRRCARSNADREQAHDERSPREYRAGHRLQRRQPATDLLTDQDLEAE